MGPASFHRFAGSPGEVGRQHGEAMRESIAAHLDRVLHRLGDVAAAETAARSFRPWVQQYAPHLDEEIDGLADGAAISVEHGYLLQLRAEVAAALRTSAPDNECTTFAATPVATATGRGLIAQNADLPGFYQDLMFVMHAQPTIGPEVLMMTPAGQVSYIGISGAGEGVVANFLHCDGWGEGFPRYLFSRYLLGAMSVDDMASRFTALQRASSRNLIVMDRAGEVLGLENTPSSTAMLRPVDGVICHANHYLSPDIVDQERSGGVNLRNSHARQARIDALVKEQTGNLTPAVAAAILRDRAGAPDAISRTWQDAEASAGVTPSDEITAASIIAEPAAGEMWVCIGPPSESEYYGYSISGGLITERRL